MDRLDASPLVARGEPRPEVAPGLVTRWAGAPRLVQDHAPAQDAGAGAHALADHGGFHRGDLGAQLGAELLRVAELGRKREGQRHRRGYRTRGGEKI